MMLVHNKVQAILVTVGTPSQQALQGPRTTEIDNGPGPVKQYADNFTHYILCQGERQMKDPLPKANITGQPHIVGSGYGPPDTHRGYLFQKLLGSARQ